MAFAYFRHVARTGNFEIIFHYRNAVTGIDRLFSFQRNVEETVDTTLKRIKLNVQKEFIKTAKKLKVKGLEANKIEVDMVVEEQDATTWSSLIANAHEHEFSSSFLKVCEQEFPFRYNYPYVNQILLPTVMLVGFKCYPSKFEVTFTDRKNCIFEWYRGLPVKSKKDEDITWVRCQSESTFFYTVQPEDLCHKLKLICTPKIGDKVGEPEEIISTGIVEIGPDHNPCEEKHKLTATPLKDPKQFRVVSYNILADYYCDSDYSRTELFPYCPPSALAIDYRKLLFINEMINYNADIYCLQEVDLKMFETDLNLCFDSANGFNGLMQRKGKNPEGVAIFFRRDKFKLVRNHGINLSETMDCKSYFTFIYDKIKNNKKLCERMSTLSTALQVTVLKSIASNKYLLVANTHLYFHPDSDHIRLLQIGFFMAYVKHIFYSTIRELNIKEEQISIIFCGDFNSVPDCGIYKLMTEKLVPEDFVDFRSNADEAVTGVKLEQPFDFKSSYGTPKYTNFTVGFADCLDYIFYQSDKLRNIQVAPLPTEEQLRSHTAIPSVVFPSDHVSLVADFEWI